MAGRTGFWRGPLSHHQRRVHVCPAGRGAFQRWRTGRLVLRFDMKTALAEIIFHKTVEYQETTISPTASATSRCWPIFRQLTTCAARSASGLPRPATTSPRKTGRHPSGNGFHGHHLPSTRLAGGTNLACFALPWSQCSQRHGPIVNMAGYATPRVEPSRANNARIGTDSRNLISHANQS